jgi:hypothetical protein
MARTFRRTPFRHTCRRRCCAYCDANRTFSTRKREVAASDALRAEALPSVEAEPVWADSFAILAADIDLDLQQQDEDYYWDKRMARYYAELEYREELADFERERAYAWD